MHPIRTQKGLTTFKETIVKIQLHAPMDVSHYNVTVMMIDEQNVGPTRRQDLSTSKRNCRAET